MIKNLQLKPKLFPDFSKQSLWLSFLVLLLSNLLSAQSPVFINTGDYGGLGWNSISSTNNLTTGSTWAGNRIILAPSGTGDKYFRFTSATSSWINYGPTSSCASDVQITGTGVATSNCDTKAFFLAIANASSNVVFKTTNGAPGTARVWANEVQGTIRSVTTVTQSPIAASVVPGQNVTVTANLDGALPTGQQVYIRYSTDNFATSTIATGTVAGTTATFTIPATTNTAAAVVRYYILTSGSTTPTHADADLMTINFNNNNGNNYSYTVNTPGTIYLHNFNTGCSSGTTCNVVPNTLNANLTTTGWTVGAGSFNTANGSGGVASSLATSAVTNSPFTLTLNVASGYQLSLSSYNYWRLSNNSGNSITSITVNGTSITSGSVSIPTASASGSLGQTNVSNAISGLTGTVTVVVNFGGTGGSFRIDDFTLNGNVTAIAPAVAPTISGFTVASPGSGTSGYVGNTITLSGTGFTGVSAIKVGAATVSGFTVVNDTTITFPAINTSGQIYVENTAGNTTSSASYTNLGYITNAAGAWGTGTTWLGGAVPPSAATTNVTIAHNISGTTGTINVGKLTVNAGVTLTNTSGTTINLNSASDILATGTIANNGTLTTAAAINNNGAFNNNGTFQINASGSINTNAPVYGSSSTLIYNGVSSYGVGTEWTQSSGTIGTTSGFPQAVTITNSSVNMPASTARGLAGTLTIGTGSTLNLGSSIGGDLNIGGNFSNSGTFNNNSRLVTFNGSGAQSVTATGVTTNFAFITYNSTSASQVFTIAENINVANELRLSQGKVTIANNKTVSIFNNATIVATLGNFSTATTGTINFLGNATTTGIIDFYPAVVQTPPSALPVSYSLDSTIQTSLTMNANSYMTNAPKYASGSTLIYNSGTNYNSGIEWGSVGTTFPANGYPHNVTIQNGTTLKIATGLTGTLRANGNLNIGVSASAGSLDMENTANSLQVNGNVAIGNSTGTSTLTLSTAVGGDLFVGGNWTRNASNGVFTPNNRMVTFNGSLTSDQTITGATTFDFLTINRNNATGNVTLAASIIVNRDLTLTNKSIVLGSFNLTLPNESSIITSNTSSYLQAIGTGQLIRQNLTTGKEYIFPLGTAASARYAPVKISNLSAGTNIGMNVATISSNTSITPSVSDWTKVVLTQWKMTSSNNVTANIYTEWQFANQGSSMVNTGSTTGDLGVSQNAGAYQIYDVNLAQYNTQANNVALSSTGTNAIVVGNDDAVSLGNNECIGAYNVVVNAAPISGTTVGASSSGIGAITCSSITATTNRDVWYKFTTGNAGNYKIDVTAGTATNIVLDLRSGNCTTSTNIACSNTTSGLASATASLALNTTYYYRVYNNSSQDGTFTTSVSTVPTITVSPTSLAFGDVSITTDSVVKTFTVKASLLTSATGNIDLTAPSGYQLSLDGTTAWSSSLSLPFTGSTLAETTIYAKLNPSTCGDFNGNIAASGGGAATTNVAVTGKGVIPTPVATAGTDITATTFTVNWAAIAGATGYKLDVYTKAASTAVNTATANWAFATAAPDAQPNNVTVSNLSQGNNNGTTTLLTTSAVSSTSDYATASGGNNAGASAITGALSTAASGSAYFEFTLTPASGASVALNSISFGSRSTSTGPQAYSVRSSLDNYASNVATGTLSNGGFWQYKSNTGLTTAGTTNQAITFRIYGHDGAGTASANTANWRIDDLNLGLSVTTPIIVNTYVNQNLNVGNTTSYTVAGLSPNTQYYYVVRATTATCESASSNEIGVLTNNSVIWSAGAWSNGTGPDETLDAIIRSPFVTGDPGQSDFTVNNLTIENTGSLQIKPNRGITVAGDITTPDNKITIESDGSLLQTKLSNGNSPNKAIAKRKVTMKRLDYTYWSSPVAGQVLRNTSSSTASTNPALFDTGGFSAGTPNNRIYQYNEPNDLFVATPDANFIAAKGYAIRGKESYGLNFTPDEFSFGGNLHNGDYSIQIQKSKNTTSGSNTFEHGYNMIGNPYPSNIDFVKFFNLSQGNGSKNSDFINGKAWFWTNVPGAPTTQGGSAYTPNNYAILSLAGGTPATGVDSGATTSPSSAIPNQYIKVAQGFIVEMKGTAPTGTTPNTATLKFDNSIRTNNSTGHFYNAKTNGNEINRYWVKLVSPGNVTNTILLAHMDAATNGYDPDYDADLLTVADDSFFSKLDTHKLQIQAKTSFNDQDMIPLGVKYALDGTYKIVLADKEGVFANGQKIYLHDKLSNTYTDLTQGNYTFQGVKGLDETRFEIVYKENLVLDTDSVSKSDFVVYKNGSDYVVRSSKPLGKVEMFDAAGRIIKAFDTKHTTLTINMNGVVDGVYIIKAQNSGDVRTKKLIK